MMALQYNNKKKVVYLSGIKNLHFQINKITQVESTIEGLIFLTIARKGNERTKNTDIHELDFNTII